MTMRDKLVRTLFDAFQHQGAVVQIDLLETVDAMLDTLREPSGPIITAMQEPVIYTAQSEGDFKEAWQAGIDAIKAGS